MTVHSRAAPWLRSLHRFGLAVAPTYCGAVRVSTRGDYACRAILSLALHGGATTPTSVRDIAQRTGLPQPYLEQILLAIKGAGIVTSRRGVGGGYVLARDPDTLTLGEIVSAVDGPIALGDFGRPHENGACDHEGQCVLLAVWEEVGSRMKSELDSLTLGEMIRRATGGRGIAPAGEAVTPTTEGAAVVQGA